MSNYFAHKLPLRWIYPPNISVSVKVCQSLSKSVKVCQSLSKSVKVCQSLSKPVKVCQSLSKSVKVCQSLSKSVKVCQSLSKSVKACQRLSKSVKVCQSLAKSVLLCQSLSGYCRSSTLLSWRHRFVDRPRNQFVFPAYSVSTNTKRTQKIWETTKCLTWGQPWGYIYQGILQYPDEDPPPCGHCDYLVISACHKVAKHGQYICHLAGSQFSSHMWNRQAYTVLY